jgi:FHS family L-fucose permease-like MFS transporter
MSSHTLSAQPAVAGSMVSIYWGLAMCGRFIGAWGLRRVRPGFALTGCAIGAIVLALTSSVSTGWIAAGTILAVGLCNSIMFPTIFTLAIEGLGEHAARASGLLSMAIVGGAVVPVITGFIADRTALNVALFVPAICYAWIALYGVLAATGAVDRRGVAAPA